MNLGPIVSIEVHLGSIWGPCKCILSQCSYRCIQEPMRRAILPCGLASPSWTSLLGFHAESTLAGLLNGFHQGSPVLNISPSSHHLVQGNPKESHGLAGFVLDLGVGLGAWVDIDVQVRVKVASRVRAHVRGGGRGRGRGRGTY